MGTFLGRVAKFALLILASAIGLILSILPLLVAVMPTPWREVVVLGTVGTALSLAAAGISRWGEKRREAKELNRLQKDEQARRLAAEQPAEQQPLEVERRSKVDELQHGLHGLHVLHASEDVARAQERSNREQEARNNQEKSRAKRLFAEERIRELAEIVRTSFLVESCPRCYENKMALISISPTVKSIEYVCTYCGKKLRAAASSPDAQKVRETEGLIVRALGRAWFKTWDGGYRCTFPVPEATLPYEQTTREPITQAMRTEVWRRDNAQCVICGSKENLQFDHIIPVSKGGATSVRNLQLLCQSCNLSKSAKI